MKKRVLSAFLLLSMVLSVCVPLITFTAAAAAPEEEPFAYDDLYVKDGLVFQMDFFALNSFWGESEALPTSPAEDSQYDGNRVTGSGTSLKATDTYAAAVEAYSKSLSTFLRSFVYKKSSALSVVNTLPEIGGKSWQDKTGLSQKAAFVLGDGFITLTHHHADSYLNFLGLPATGAVTGEFVMTSGGAVLGSDTLFVMQNTSLGATVSADKVVFTKFPGLYPFTTKDTDFADYTLSNSTSTPFTVTLQSNRAVDGDTVTSKASLFVNTHSVVKNAVIADKTAAENPVTVMGYVGENDHDIYAVRYYNRALTGEEMINNAFADLCKWYKLDMYGYTLLSAEVRAAVQAEVLSLAAEAGISVGGDADDRVAIQKIVSGKIGYQLYRYDEFLAADSSPAAKQFIATAEGVMADISALLALPLEYRALVYTAVNSMPAADKADRAKVEAMLDERITAVLATYYSAFVNETNLTYKDLYVKQENLVLWVDFFAARATDGKLYMDYSYVSDPYVDVTGKYGAVGKTWANWDLPVAARTKVPQVSGEAAAREKYVYKGNESFGFLDIGSANFGHSNIRTWGNGRLECGLNNSLLVYSPGMDVEKLSYQFVAAWEGNLNLQLDGVRMDSSMTSSTFKCTQYQYYGYGVDSRVPWQLQNAALMYGNPGMAAQYVGSSVDLTLTVDKRLGVDEGHYYLADYSTNTDGAIAYVDVADPVTKVRDTIYGYKVAGTDCLIKLSAKGSESFGEARYALNIVGRVIPLLDAEGYEVTSVPVMRAIDGTLSFDWENAVYKLNSNDEKVMGSTAVITAVNGPCYKNPATEVSSDVPGALGPIKFQGMYDLAAYANSKQFVDKKNLSYQRLQPGSVGNGGNISVYAVRTYDCVLTDADMLQNHFADIVGYYGIDLTSYTFLSDSERRSLYADLADMELGLPYEEGRAKYAAAIGKYLYPFNSQIEGFSHFTEICDAFNLDTRSLKDLSDVSLARIFASFADVDPTVRNYSPLLQKKMADVLATELEAHYAAAYGHKTLNFEGWQLKKSGAFGLRALYSSNLAAISDLEAKGNRVMTGVLVAPYGDAFTALDDLAVSYVDGEVKLPEGAGFVKGYWNGTRGETATEKDGVLYFTHDTIMETDVETDTDTLIELMRRKYFYVGFTVVVSNATGEATVFYDDATAAGMTGAQSLYTLARAARHAQIADKNVQSIMNTCTGGDYCLDIQVDGESLAGYNMLVGEDKSGTDMLQSAIRSALGISLTEVKTAEGNGCVILGAMDNAYDDACYGISFFGGNVYLWYNSGATQNDVCRLFTEYLAAMQEAEADISFAAGEEIVCRVNR